MAYAPEQAVVILGTSRSDGNTRLAVERVLAGRPVKIVDLSKITVSAYDYSHKNAGDDFLPFIEEITAKQLWILATPVYWYTMSAQMKIFVDRLSDLITIRKDLGRALRGKAVAIVASGTDNLLPESFESPVRLTCEYLNMNYVGAFYSQFEKNDQPSPSLDASARAFGAIWLS